MYRIVSRETTCKITLQHSAAPELTMGRAKVKSWKPWHKHSAEAVGLRLAAWLQAERLHDDDAEYEAHTAVDFADAIVSQEDAKLAQNGVWHGFVAASRWTEQKREKLWTVCEWWTNEPGNFNLLAQRARSQFSTAWGLIAQQDAERRRLEELVAKDWARRFAQQGQSQNHFLDVASIAQMDDMMKEAQRLGLAQSKREIAARQREAEQRAMRTFEDHWQRAKDQSPPRPIGVPLDAVALDSETLAKLREYAAKQGPLGKALTAAFTPKVLGIDYASGEKKKIK